MPAREPQLIVATGQKGIGKTFLTDKFIMGYLMGVDDPFNKVLNDANVSLFLSKVPTRKKFPKGRSVLIFDANLEDYWTKYDTLSYDCDDPDFHSRTKHIRKFGEYSSKGYILCRRIVPVKPNGKPMSKDEMRQTVMDIIESARNCLLLLDDTNSYFRQVDYNESPLAQKITTNRHSNLDILMHIQGLRMSPMMFQNVGYIRMHKQSDAVDRYKSTIPSFDVAKIAQIITDKRYEQGRIRTFLYIDLSGRRIYGVGEYQITPQEFNMAAREFLIGNRKFIKPLLDEIASNITEKKPSKNLLLQEAISLWIQRNNRIAFS